MNDPIKIGAVIAAVLLIGSQYLPQIAAMLKKAWSAMPSMPQQKSGIDGDDLTMVLDLASRLRQDGNLQATDLAKQLLDAMLDPPEVKK